MTEVKNGPALTELLNRNKNWAEFDGGKESRILQEP